MAFRYKSLAVNSQIVKAWVPVTHVFISPLQEYKDVNGCLSNHKVSLKVSFRAVRTGTMEYHNDPCSRQVSNNNVANKDRG